MTESETMMLIKFVWAGWPNFSIEPETVTHFYTLLKDFSLSTMRDAAIEALKKDRTHPPTAGELLSVNRQLILAKRRRQMPQLSLPEPDSTLSKQTIEDVKANYPELFK